MKTMNSKSTVTPTDAPKAEPVDFIAVVNGALARANETRKALFAGGLHPNPRLGDPRGERERTIDDRDVLAGVALFRRAMSACRRDVCGCGGTGFIEDGFCGQRPSERRPCSVCRGTGRIPTAIGVALLTTIRDLIAPPIQEEATPEAIAGWNKAATAEFEQKHVRHE